jgi:hypothetical protein
MWSTTVTVAPVVGHTAVADGGSRAYIKGDGGRPPPLGRRPLLPPVSFLFFFLFLVNLISLDLEN